MAADTGTLERKLDPRIYVAILFFRWKLLAVCFLYSLLAGVVYLQVTGKEYVTSTRIMLYRNPSLRVGMDPAELWTSFSMYDMLLTGEKLRQRVVEKLTRRWAQSLGGVQNMYIPVSTRFITQMWMFDVYARSPVPAYAEDFLTTLTEEFQEERRVSEEQARASAYKVLEDELARLEERVNAAEEEVIEFQRLHQTTVIAQKGSMELGYLNWLMNRRGELSTEMMMLDVQYPAIKSEGASVIADVNDLTRETGTRPPETMAEGGGESEPGGGAAPAAGKPGAKGGAAAPAAIPDAALKKRLDEAEAASPAVSTEQRADQLRSWQGERIELEQLKLKEKDLLATLQPSHPEVQALQKRINELQTKLDFSTQVELARLQDRRKAIQIQLDALEAAERRWQNTYLMASKKQADLRRLQNTLTRLESMYQSLYDRLFSFKVDEEMKAEHFSVIIPPNTGNKPAWPDPAKVLLIALAVGLGTGIGLAFLTHFLDNKIQSIADVETMLGISFLGGVPFWVSSDLNTRIRPIVTDEHSSGAAEAYRALRTNVLSVLDKAREKVVMVTSADSKEGKTLTTLNLAIMIAKAGKKVLLLDLDLRRGLLYKSLGVEKTPGITEALANGLPLSRIIVPTSHENLWFAPAGAASRNTAELLHGVDLKHFFAEVREQYDYILMDSAPVLRVTDTVILADPAICSVIYIAHANRTTKAMVRYSLSMLGDARVLGMIINSIEMHKLSSLYYAYMYPNYAYYSYAYAYGYDYYMSDGVGRFLRRRGAATGLKTHVEKIRHWFRRNFMPVE